ncbi:MAG: LPP20 family lipoprotein [Elusimicrobia bacterium]|nr:LPP20 family lipoprotein [Elusimicrobiota bacterium]
MRLLVPVLVSCVAGAAAAKDPKPEWINGASSEYPRSKYVTGVGLADKEQEAKDRARAEISKVFRVEIDARSADHLSEASTTSESGKDKKSTYNFAQTIAFDVKTTAKQVQEGVEVVENWRDPASKGYYALAVLEKEKAAAIIRDKIEEIDKQAEEWRNQLDAAGEKLPKIKAAMKFLAVLKGRDQLNAQYRILDAAGKGLPSPFNTAQVKGVADKAIRELEVYVNFDCSMKGEFGQAANEACGKEVETGIMKGLNSFGFEAQTRASSGATDIAVEGSVSIQPQRGNKEGWQFARGTLTVTLKDGRSNKTIQSFDRSDKGASSDYEEAARRLRVTLGKLATQDVREAIVTYFENQ